MKTVLAIGKGNRQDITFKKAIISPEMLNAHRGNGERKERTFKSELLQKYTTTEGRM
ncbi:hypothetical protein IC620_15625 [Hazenella sp. IB182357]|uniref:Uncharacterized protein n=1 Tax=Polycladospora coralii TaxID=2771432 RepID=A0A926NE73_9BACL|nr:hypothetical protein [Polycladospora coralii]MBD1373775.1 hypothetical protein [Polycladospora coralii]